MDSPPVYEITIREQISPAKSHRFEGMSITRQNRDQNAKTILTGPVVDQSELHGLLAKIRDLNLTLIELRQIAMQPSAAESGMGIGHDLAVALKDPAQDLQMPAVDLSVQDKPDGHLIELRDLVKVYHTPAGDFPALRNINLSVGYGEFVAVVGKSGSGKTTMINMLTGIDRPTSGTVLVDDLDIHKLNESDMSMWRGRNLGVVFQFFQLLPTLTLVENVTLPMDLCGTYPLRERHQRALHLLELVDIAENADKLPSEISGGQQQRAAIARALANDPPIIAADEPTGNLDSKTADAIIKLFQSLIDRGTTILMVSHDTDLAMRASRIVELADGMIIRC
jgi:putative ABC transport system ATP-binding protein